MFNGKLYKFTCLINRLCSGPCKFTKFLKPAFTSLRKTKTVISAYIDDLITIAYSYDSCYNNIFKCINLLDSLGFVAHQDKSQFIHSRSLEYLEFIINFVSMTVELTEAKIFNVQTL